VLSVTARPSESLRGPAAWVEVVEFELLGLRFMVQCAGQFEMASYGSSWQIVPYVMRTMMADAKRAQAKCATDAMLEVVKSKPAALAATYAAD
jgi:predicted 3-demethylubiquinone-9 3-methyltransferase (glyoxalase superfamily)